MPGGSIELACCSSTLLFSSRFERKLHIFIEAELNTGLLMLASSYNLSLADAVHTQMNRRAACMKGQNICVIVVFMFRLKCFPCSCQRDVILICSAP